MGIWEVYGSCGCRSHCHGCMNVAWAMFWGGSRSTKPCVFPCKVVAAGDERYLVCAAVAAGSFHARIVAPMCFVTSGCSCVRRSTRILISGGKLHWNGCFIVVI